VARRRRELADEMAGARHEMAEQVQKKGIFPWWRQGSGEGASSLGGARVQGKGQLASPSPREVSNALMLLVLEAVQNSLAGKAAFLWHPFEACVCDP
jgi:hypothetical protein